MTPELEQLQKEARDVLYEKNPGIEYDSRLENALEEIVKVTFLAGEKSGNKEERERIYAVWLADGLDADYWGKTRTS